MLRVGFGFDAHRLVVGRRLILGGVEIPHELGLEGHSDADVLTHAVMDALLGAVGRGDIGQHFPDTDPRLAGADSIGLLRQVVALLELDGFRSVQIDATIIAQAPRLTPFRAAMTARLADALGVLPGEVNVKFTTTEGLGFTGSEEGIAAYAVATVTS